MDKKQKNGFLTANIYQIIIITIVVALFATVACMMLLAGCGTLLFGRPFVPKLTGYILNNLAWATTLGTVLFVSVLGPAFRKGCVYGREWDRRRGLDGD